MFLFFLNNPSWLYPHAKAAASSPWTIQPLVLHRSTLSAEKRSGHMDRAGWMVMDCHSAIRSTAGCEWRRSVWIRMYTMHIHKIPFFSVDTYMCAYVQYMHVGSVGSRHIIYVYIRMVHKILVHFYAMHKLGSSPNGSEDFCVLRLWSSSLLSNRHDWCILWAYCLLTFLDWFVFSLDFLFLCFSLENHRKPKETHRIHPAPNQRNQRIPKEKKDHNWF